MIDTRMKVDGKWNFKMDNVWFLLLMIVLGSWCVAEISVAYDYYKQSNTWVITPLFLFTVAYIMIVIQRRVIDVVHAKYIELEKRVKALEGGE
ncbi:hypothetical protein phiAS5_ORF0275 [Aeromonas phage phiAS5]|uniref:Uncharacterized protein n=1 Tax=Aeromonas phage phiAS5 TaxID=879630 RepID=E1A229_9CAUD|nr:hypothetical protein phiAS5_ORF0275 [Aeromonas phage phiAS5]ADM80118.1 hypothetical protein phiAS5_ORF0275 [Aeromonas phage phiAS5]BES53119.1 hypothetical protein [Aeromonas phage phiWae14]